MLATSSPRYSPVLASMKMWAPLNWHSCGGAERFIGPAVPASQRPEIWTSQTSVLTIDGLASGWSVFGSTGTGAGLVHTARTGWTDEARLTWSHLAASPTA